MNKIMISGNPTKGSWSVTHKSSNATNCPTLILLSCLIAKLVNILHNLQLETVANISTRTDFKQIPPYIEFISL